MCVSVCVHVLHLLAEEEPSGPVNDLCQLGRLRSQLRSPASGASKSSPLSVSASQWCHQLRAWQAESHSLSSTSDMADTHTDTYNVLILVTVRVTHSFQSHSSKEHNPMMVSQSTGVCQHINN